MPGFLAWFFLELLVNVVVDSHNWKVFLVWAYNIIFGNVISVVEREYLLGMESFGILKDWQRRKCLSVHEDSSKRDFWNGIWSLQLSRLDIRKQ